MGKTVAIDAGKKLVEKATKKLSTQISQVANVMVPPEEITNKLNRPNASNTFAIQDFVERLNVSDLKIT